MAAAFFFTASGSHGLCTRAYTLYHECISSLLHNTRQPDVVAPPSALGPAGLLSAASDPDSQQDPVIGLLGLPDGLLDTIATLLPDCWYRHWRLTTRALRRTGLARVRTLRLQHPEHLTLRGPVWPPAAAFPDVTALTLLPSTDAAAWYPASAQDAARHLLAWAASLTHLDLGGLCCTAAELAALLPALPALSALAVPALWVPSLVDGARDRVLSSLTPGSLLSPAAQHAVVCTLSLASVLTLGALPSSAAAVPTHTHAVHTLLSLPHLRRLDLRAWRPHPEALAYFSAAAGGLPALQELCVSLQQGYFLRQADRAQTFVEGVAGCAALRVLTYEGPLVSWRALRDLRHLSSLVLRVDADSMGNAALQGALALTKLQSLSVTANFGQHFVQLQHFGSGLAPSGALHSHHSLTDLRLLSTPRKGRRAYKPSELFLWDLRPLALAFPHLRSLTVPAVFVPWAEPTAVLPQLRCLTLGDSLDLYEAERPWEGVLSSVFPGLESLSTQHPMSLQCRLGRRLEHGLTTLDVNAGGVSSNHVHDTSDALLYGLMSLRSLTLRNARAVSFDALLTVAANNPLLEVLCLTHAAALDDAAAWLLAEHLPCLHTFTLRECHGVTAGGLRALAALPGMRQLAVQRCRSVSRPAAFAMLERWPGLGLEWEEAEWEEWEEEEEEEEEEESNF